MDNIPRSHSRLSQKTDFLPLKGCRNDSWDRRCRLRKTQTTSGDTSQRFLYDLTIKQY